MKMDDDILLTIILVFVCCMMAVALNEMVEPSKGDEMCILLTNGLYDDYKQSFVDDYKIMSCGNSYGSESYTITIGRNGTLIEEYK